MMDAAVIRLESREYKACASAHLATPSPLTYYTQGVCAAGSRAPCPACTLCSSEAGVQGMQT